MRRVLATSLTAAALAMWSPGLASATSSWTIQPVPLPAGATVAQLTSVSCPAATSCAAVGFANNGSLQAWLWDGSSWSVSPVPVPAGTVSSSLNGVSCDSSTSCTVVGEYFNSSDVESTLTEHWDGSTWSVRPSPNPLNAVGSELNAVSCASATRCTAVGDDTRSDGTDQILAEHWNGSTWSLQATPIPAGATHSLLDAVSCRPAASCMAVGWYTDSSNTEHTLAEHWGGTSWTIQATVGAPNAALGGVSCVSATSCTAVGADAAGVLAENWDGSSWSAQPVPVPVGTVLSSLSGVSCTSASACTAVGRYTKSTGPVHALAERWNGSVWKTQQTVTPTAHKVLNAVSCTASRTCTAVGLIRGAGTVYAPLAEHE